MVIYILTKAVEHEFKISNFQSFARMGRMSPTHRHLATRQRLADQITMDDALEMVSIITNLIYRVQSFTDSSIFYTISLESDNSISSCSCGDWEIHQLSCKHMFLLIRVHSYISLPSTTVALAIDSHTTAIAQIPNPNIQNESNEFLNRIKRIDRSFRILRLNGIISSEILEIINQKSEDLESFLEQLDRRTSFIPQSY